MKIHIYLRTLLALGVFFALSNPGISLNNTYDGWTGGPITTYKCLDVECTNSDGCSPSWHFPYNSQYDTYWSQVRCQSTGNSGDSCSQTYHKCRETDFYSLINCGGTIQYETINFYGACSGA